ncbi:MAG: alanyl-tRNA editing protein [Lachnospiraceae bacterium]|nr:alanyl-tRNA editing protein [Lachnospiraceae bacterium]
MTEKLYDLDSYVTEFDATVIDFREKKDFCELVLDRTAFFPEGGGQSSDIGEISGYQVVDVRIKQDEIIHYIAYNSNEDNDNKYTRKTATLNSSGVTDSISESDSAARISDPTITEMFRIGSQVHGRINWGKRFERMQQHSGEHLLSGFVFKQFGYHNTGFHLSDNGTTVDFDGTFTDEDLILIEDTVNKIILKNVPSHIYFPSPGELKNLTYRSKKELEGPVRIVEFSETDNAGSVMSTEGVAVADNYPEPYTNTGSEQNNTIVYDRCACCAPHVRSTIEIGLFKILSAEHFKGGTRMVIACGQRLLNEMRIMQDNVTGISRLLSVKPENTAQGVEKLNDSYKSLKFNMIRIEKELLEMTAAHAEKPVIFLESAETGNVRTAVNSLAQRFDGYCCAFTGNDDRGYNFIITSRDADCTVLLQKMKDELKASGGGSKTMIQGNIKAPRQAVIDLIEVP